VTGNGRGFWGKYRGVVTDTDDPLQMGRVRARIPDVLGSEESGWAMPCAPFGGDGTGFFAVPKVGAGVWIEFEHGDPDFPILAGCWWGSATERANDLLPLPTKKVIVQTEGGHKIVLDDTPGSGGILLETAGGQKVKLTATGIEIDDGQGGKITLQASMMNVNNGALEVQ
jgi:uncharacterized protein involved in type VI secretion and phage assembly